LSTSAILPAAVRSRCPTGEPSVGRHQYISTVHHRLATENVASYVNNHNSFPSPTKRHRAYCPSSTFSLSPEDHLQNKVHTQEVPSLDLSFFCSLSVEYSLLYSIVRQLLTDFQKTLSTRMRKKRQRTSSIVALAAAVTLFLSPHTVHAFMVPRHSHTTIISSSKSRIEQLPQEDAEAVEPEKASGWLSRMIRGKKGGTAEVRMREAEELGGVPRSDRYSSR